MAPRWRPYGLCATRLVEVEPSLSVANMIRQHGIRSAREVPPIRYDALEACLTKLVNDAVDLSASVHMPGIGCGLAGGTWDVVEVIVTRTLVSRRVDVTVYDLP